MKNKKWLAVLIIGFPSFFWLILESSTINSKKLPYYGPKASTGSASTGSASTGSASTASTTSTTSTSSVAAAASAAAAAAAAAVGDTIYYQVTDKFYIQEETLQSGGTNIVKIPDPVYAIIFVNKKYRQDSYRLTGLWEYLNYKNQKVEHIPFILVTESDSGRSQAYEELKKLSESKNVHFYNSPRSSFDSIVKTYFLDKPYYIDYSFFLLIDRNRHIRGYYDGRYVSELKRLIDEYQHLRLKEEKQKLTEANEIKSNI